MAVDILRYEMFVNHEIFKQIHILGDELRYTDTELILFASFQPGRQIDGKLK